MTSHTWTAMSSRSIKRRSKNDSKCTQHTSDVSVDFCLTKLDNRIVFVPVSILITTRKWFAHFLALHLCSGTLIHTCSHPFSILRCERQSFNFRHFLHRCSDVRAASRFTASSIIAHYEDSMVCTRPSSSHAPRKFINMWMCRLLVATWHALNG